MSSPFPIALELLTAQGQGPRTRMGGPRGPFSSCLGLGGKTLEAARHVLPVWDAQLPAKGNGDGAVVGFLPLGGCTEPWHEPTGKISPYERIVLQKCYNQGVD